MIVHQISKIHKIIFFLCLSANLMGQNVSSLADSFSIEIQTVVDYGDSTYLFVVKNIGENNLIVPTLGTRESMLIFQTPDSGKISRSYEFGINQIIQPDSNFIWVMELWMIRMLLSGVYKFNEKGNYTLVWELNGIRSNEVEFYLDPSIWKKKK